MCHAQAGDRREIDDRALALLLHHRQHVLAAQERGLEIVVDLRVPDLFAHGHRVAGRRAADVVDEDVDAAELLHAIVHGGLDLLGLRHVDAAREAGAAFPLDDGLGDVGCLLAQIDAVDLARPGVPAARPWPCRCPTPWRRDRRRQSRHPI